MTALDTPEGNLSYGYDNADRKTSMTDSAGTTSYSYDDDSRLTSLTNANSETTTWGYDADARTTSQTVASGEVSTFAYDNRGRQTSVTHKTSGGTTLESESYGYDLASNLTSKTVGSLTTEYTYDNANQLLTESNSGYSASYTYDANGNRTSKTLNGTTDTYTVDNGDKLTSTSTKTFTYDGDGRTHTVTTGGVTTTLSYDYESRITSIANGTSTFTYSYNGLDTRVGKNEGTSQTFRRDGAGVTAPVLNDGVGEFTPGVSEHTSSTTFSHTDQLGSNVAQTNSSQSLTATQQYDAFGLLVSSSGTQVGPFGFVGKEGYQTDASGLMLLGHRYYDPSTGRFLTRAPAKDGRNWYAYCEARPASTVDPSGRDVWSVAGHFLLGLVVGAATAVVVAVAAPVVVTGLTAVAVGAELAGTIVTVGLGIGAAGGAFGAAGSAAVAIQRRDWDALATIVGGIVGGGLVGGFGGGRRLGGLGGKPSPAPPLTGLRALLGYEVDSGYNPKLGPPGTRWLGTGPTVGAGTLILAAGGAGTGAGAGNLH